MAPDDPDGYHGITSMLRRSFQKRAHVEPENPGSGSSSLSHESPGSDPVSSEFDANTSPGRVANEHT